MTTNSTPNKFPATYTVQVKEKSNLLLRANLLDAQKNFDEAAELFARVAQMESKLAEIARQHGEPQIALVHLVSEMSCWAAAGDTYRALALGQQILASTSLSPSQQSHVRSFVTQLNDRRRVWMESWHDMAPVAA